MSEEVISQFFLDTGKKICPGELITIDGREGRVEAVFDIESEEARNFSCYDTGGILVIFEDVGPVLFPFGNAHVVRSNHTFPNHTFPEK